MNNLEKKKKGTNCVKPIGYGQSTETGVSASFKMLKSAGIKMLWKKATYGQSYIVHIEDTQVVSNAAAYMTKYMTKQLNGGDNFKRGERRYGISKGRRRVWP